MENEKEDIYSAPDATQCVIITLRRSANDAEGPYHALAAAVQKALPDEYDGWETDDCSQFLLYLYGPDADAIWETVRSVIEVSPLARGGEVYRRYGPIAPGTKTRTAGIGGRHL